MPTDRVSLRHYDGQMKVTAKGRALYETLGRT